jgi:hypothetical protein
MNKVATDTRKEKFNDLFYETENFSENQDLGFVNSSKMLLNEETAALTEKSNTFLNIIKQILLFLPGTFLLYLIGFIGTIILIDTFSVKEPLEIFGLHSVPLQMLLFGIIALFGTFMTWFGLGDIKNKKHFAIPTSILATGGILAVISKILGDVFGFSELFEAMNYYFIYLFPLVLIVPILVKSWLDTDDKQNETN